MECNSGSGSKNEYLRYYIPWKLVGDRRAGHDGYGAGI
jgi:hypothetical protein